MKITALRVDFNLGGDNITVYPVIITHGEEVILVDCGYPDSLPKIEAEMDKLNISPRNITKIVITHHDHDHMGALKALKEKYPAIEIMCSKEEAPYITGRRKSLRLQQAQAIQDTLPENEKEGGIQFQRFIESIEKVDSVIEIDSDQLCDGIEVLDTKGHMPGHISLYIPSQKTLISGDALVIEDGDLCMAMPQFILDKQSAQDSIRKLLSYDIEVIICYHGGEYHQDIKKRLMRIVEQFKEDD